MTEEQRKPYDKLRDDDAKRLEKETKQLQDLGYFINSDGVKSTNLTKKGKVTDFPLGTVLPKKAAHPYLCFATEYHKENDTKGSTACDTMKIISGKWNSMTEKQKKKYEDLSQKDRLRYDDQIDQLKKNGFFMSADGTKSTDMKYKAPK